MLEELKLEVYKANMMLPKYNIVTLLRFQYKLDDLQSTIKAIY